VRKSYAILVSPQGNQLLANDTTLLLLSNNGLYSTSFFYSLILLNSNLIWQRVKKAFRPKKLKQFQSLIPSPKNSLPQIFLWISSKIIKIKPFPFIHAWLLTGEISVKCRYLHVQVNNGVALQNYKTKLENRWYGMCPIMLPFHFQTDDNPLVHESTTYITWT